MKLKFGFLETNDGLRALIWPQRRPLKPSISDVGPAGGDSVDEPGRKMMGTDGRRGAR